MKKIFVLVIFLSFFNQILSQKKVLFIGNSLLYFNEMPSDFNQMMQNEDDSIVVHQLTSPGSSLQGHLNRYNYSKKKPIDFTKLGRYRNRGESLDYVKLHRYKNRGDDMERMKKRFGFDLDIDTIHKSTLQLTLEKNKYDYIIIQDHGSMIVNPRFQKYIAAKSLERLDSLLTLTNSPETKLIYFTEYPNKVYYKKNYKDNERNLVWKPYDTITCNPIEPKDSNYLFRDFQLFDSILIINTPLEAIESYEAGLIKLKEVKDFEISPTARIFDILKTENPKWKMYGGGGHPSKITSFMFACVYYEMITGKSCVELEFNGKLSEKKAKIVKSTVHKYFSSN